VQLYCEKSASQLIIEY